MKINPRRPLDNDKPNGYLESDIDYVKNNLELCVSYLDAIVAEIAKIKTELDAGQSQTIE